MSKYLDEAEWKLDCLNSRLDALTKADADPCWEGYEQAGTKEKSGKTVPNCVKADAFYVWDEKGNRKKFDNKRQAQSALVKAAEKLAKEAPHLPGSNWLVMDAKSWDGSSKFNKGLRGYGELLAFESSD